MEEEKKEAPPESSEVPKDETAKLLEDQRRKVETLAKVHEQKPSRELKLELDRERDRLRHLVQVHKGNPKERAEAKAKYASKAALSRAIQPVSK